VKYDVTEMSFDCAKEMYRDEYVAYYYTDGTNDRSERKDWGGMNWSAVPPDTVVKGTLDFICAWKPK